MTNIIFGGGQSTALLCLTLTLINCGIYLLFHLSMLKILKIYHMNKVKIYLSRQRYAWKNHKNCLCMGLNFILIWTVQKEQHQEDALAKVWIIFMVSYSRVGQETNMPHFPISLV